MQDSITYLRLLVPTAGPVPARENADYIMKIAKRVHGQVDVIHIIDKALVDTEKMAEGQKALEIFKYAGDRFGVKVNTHLKEGTVVPIITSFAIDEHIDLIVMGASEDGKIVAEWIVSDLKEKTKVPVVIVPYGLSNILELNEGDELK